MIWTGMVGALLALSLLGNALLYIRIKAFKRRPQTQSLELQDFLLDVRNGVGLLAVSRIDPDQILLRSPRQR